MGFPNGLRTQRAKQFCERVFVPHYNSLQYAANRTPLVIMLWLPASRAEPWASKRYQILAKLEQLGHRVFFSEELGTPTTPRVMKGIEYLQSETVDLIVVAQPAYGPIGDVYHFVEYRVIDSKMLLFVDQAAPDRLHYEYLLGEMETQYNNVETFRFPGDLTQDLLLKKIVSKVALMQTVKYHATQRAQSWGLRSDSYLVQSTPLATTRRPFRYNLLELYREHRDEISVLRDAQRLFILAYVNAAGGMMLRRLAHDLGAAEPLLDSEIVPLRRNGMLATANGSVAVTEFGRRLLDDVGLGARAMPVSTQPQTINWRQSKTVRGLAFSLATALTLLLAALYISNTAQRVAPLEYTPSAPMVTPANPTTTPSLRTPTPLISPVPTRR